MAKSIVLLLCAWAVLFTSPSVGAAQARHSLCHDHFATIIATNRNDFIVGSHRRDVIVLRRGNDAATGLTGRDIICGGRGNDYIEGDHDRDRLFGGKGRDIIKGGPGLDRAHGGPRHDHCKGIEIVHSCDTLAGPA